MRINLGSLRAGGCVAAHTAAKRPCRWSAPGRFAIEPSKRHDTVFGPTLGGEERGSDGLMLN